jgi:parallel beta-helix repeat protein
LLGMRSEMVFVDDTMLKQVLDRKDLPVDGYCADEKGERIYIRLKAGAKPQEHKIDVTVRQAGLLIGDEWAVDQYPSYIAVKGIQFNRYVRNCFLGKHVLLEDCGLAWNNEGLPIGGEDYVLRRVVAVHNGGRTLVIPPRGGVPGLPNEIKNEHKNGLLEDVTASYGNWRLFDYGGLEEWATAGFKVHTLSNLILRRMKIEHNHAPGFWMDTKCNNVLLEDSLIYSNRLSGVWIEICNGDTVVRNNVIAKNAKGFNLSNSSHVTAEGNTFYGNKEQVGYWGKGGVRSGFRTVDLKMINNRFVASEPGQVLINLPGFDYIPETATFAKNVYYIPGGAPAFMLGGPKMSFEQWQQKMKDTDSIMADPMFRNPEALDFTPKAGSPLLQKK